GFSRETEQVAQPGQRQRGRTFGHTVGGRTFRQLKHRTPKHYGVFGDLFSSSKKSTSTTTRFCVNLTTPWQVPWPFAIRPTIIAYQIEADSCNRQFFPWRIAKRLHHYAKCSTCWPNSKLLRSILRRY